MKSVWFWGILLLAVALRAWLLAAAFGDADRALTSDSRDYVFLSEVLAQTGQFAAGDFEPRPEIFRTPGYPAFLLAPHALAAKIDRGMTNWQWAVAIQVLIDAHLVGLTYWLGRTLADHRTGLAAALFQAISPLAVASSCRILTDGTFAFLLTAAVLLAVRHFRTGGWPSLLAAAAVVGLACYVRPVGLAMAGVFAGVLLFRPKRLRRAGAFAGVVAAVVAPWVIRNATVADYVGFSSFATDSMDKFSAAEVVARTEGVPVETVRRRFRRQEGWDSYDPDLVGQPGLTDAPAYRTPGGLARYRRDRAMRIIGEHPWTYAGIHLKGCLAFWLPGATDVLEIAGYTSGERGTLDVLHREGLAAAVRYYFGDNTAAMWLAGAMGLVLLARYAGAVLCGLWKLRLRMPAAGWLMLLLTAAAFLLPGPAAHPRFRVPVAPILSVAAAVGWICLCQRIRQAKPQPPSS